MGEERGDGAARCRALVGCFLSGVLGGCPPVPCQGDLGRAQPPAWSGCCVENATWASPSIFSYLALNLPPLMTVTSARSVGKRRSERPNLRSWASSIPCERACVLGSQPEVQQERGGRELWTSAFNRPDRCREKGMGRMNRCWGTTRLTALALSLREGADNSAGGR